MPINSKYKTIFVHIPKCAGTSIEKYLGMSTIDNLFSYKPIKLTTLKYDTASFTEEELKQFEEVTPQHLTATQLKKIIPEKIFNSYFKFSVVRNPYDRLLSEYAYIHETPTTKTSRFRNLSFADFIDEVFALDSISALTLFDGHLNNQSDYIYDEKDNLLVDQVYKVEELNACITKLQQLSSSTRTLPHSRATSFSSDEDFFTQINKDKIYERYERDFILLNYTR